MGGNLLRISLGLRRQDELIVRRIERDIVLLPVAMPLRGR